MHIHTHIISSRITLTLSNLCETTKNTNKLHHRCKKVHRVNIHLREFSRPWSVFYMTLSHLSHDPMNTKFTDLSLSSFELLPLSYIYVTEGLIVQGFVLCTYTSKISYLSQTLCELQFLDLDPDLDLVKVISNTRIWSSRLLNSCRCFCCCCCFSVFQYFFQVQKRLSKIQKFF